MEGKELEKTPPGLEGVFETWDEAEALGRGFRSERWIKRIESQLEDYLQDIKKYGSQALPPRPCSLPMLCTLTRTESIVDLGGSSGWAWYYIKQSVPCLTVKVFDIIEIDVVCRFFRDSKYHIREPLKYFTISEYSGRCDILYSNSILQYILDENFLDVLDIVKPEYILLEDVIAGKQQQYYTLQIYYGDKIPVNVRNFGSFLNLLYEFGYEMLYHQPYITEHAGVIQSLPMSAIPEDLRIKYAHSIFLRRRTS